MSRSRSSARRLTLTIVGVFAVVAVFTGRLVDLQVVQAKSLTAEAIKNRSQTITTYGTRGAIVDSNGVVMADSVDRFDITASPKVMLGVYKAPADLSSALTRVGALTGTPTADLIAAIQKNPQSDFAYIAKAVSLDVFTAVQKLKISGLAWEPHPSRSYPNGAIAGNLLGFIGTDGAQAGVELAYDRCLASKNGSSTYEKSRDGTRIPGSTVKQTDPTNGGTLKLTIDNDLQYDMQTIIDAQRKKLGSPWATAVVERVKDGHLLAVADSPTVDPNNVNGAKRTALGSLAFSTPYEPGSTFKAMTAASLIDSGAITPLTKITAPSVYTTGLPKGQYIKDSFFHPAERWTTAGVLENSSNIGISILSQNLDKYKRHDYMAKFGVGSKTAVTFRGQSAGYLSPAANWDPITNRAVSFGQGVSATSVQVAQIFSTLANHGVRPPSTLVESCTSADGKVTDTQTTKPVRVISAKAADETVGMLETVVTGGPISQELKIPGYRIAAKTGTAQVASTNGTGYTNKYILSVAGIAPAENPEYVVVVTFGPTTMGSSLYAAPAFKKAMTDVLTRYRVEPSTHRAPFVQTTW